MIFFLRILLLAILLPATSVAEDDHSHQDQTKAFGVEALSHKLRHLLIQEMQALQTGMVSIIPAYISGNWEEIESIAKKMKNSYILKQNLTDHQMHELHTVLPPLFIEKDQRFHYLAGMLEHAAQNKKPELVNFYFSELNESCLDCHSKFATHKFPVLIKKYKKESHNH